MRVGRPRSHAAIESALTRSWLDVPVGIPKGVFLEWSLSDTEAKAGVFHPFDGVFGRSSVSQMALRESR